ncbi:Rv1535 domain-containing protein [Mycobacterium sp. pUA109]|uniref:Rv1535 domain-containing protein n=1 Tax=Mycobacterium sp. pUA109 TaxID=3238982 RepID=UPI00351B245F
MQATAGLDDLLVSVTARLLTVPLQEVYALLWRAGVLELHQADGRSAPADLSRDDHPADALSRPPRPSRPRPTLAPAPSPAVRPGYSRAVG